MGPDGTTPRRLHMHGNDAISGSHFDEWCGWGLAGRRLGCIWV
jgi:hypothetical protein